MDLVFLIKEIQSVVLQHAALKQMGRHVKAHAIHALALRGMSARDASPRFSRNFSIQKKAKNVCRAIFVMLSWLAAVHIDFAAVSSTVMPLFQMF